MAETGSERAGRAESRGRPRRHSGSSVVEVDVFAATEKLLETMSHRELTVAKILEAASISRGTFYFYFSSKNDVISGLLRQVSESLMGAMEPWTNRSDDDPEPALRESITTVAEVWRQHHAVLQACQEGWVSSDDLASAWVTVMSRFTDEMSDVIQVERARGAAPQGMDARELAATLTWSAEHMLYLAGRGLLPGAGSVTDAVDLVVETFLKTIYGVLPSSS